MFGIYQWLYSIAILCSVIRVVILVWITIRCGRFLRGHWWRVCCGSAVQTTVFVVTCFGHSLCWTIHACFLCVEMGLTLTDQGSTGAPGVFCNAQATSGLVSVSVNVALTISQLMANLILDKRVRNKWTRNITITVLIVVIPVVSVLLGRFRYDHSYKSNWDYVDVSDTLARDFSGQNISVDLHLLLCDKDASIVKPLTTLPILMEVALVLGLVVLTMVAKCLIQESRSLVISSGSISSSRINDDHFPCTNFPHPVDWISNTLPLVISFWVLIVHPLLYTLFSQRSSWLNVGVGTHLLLALSSISVAMCRSTSDDSPTSNQSKQSLLRGEI